MVSCAVNYLAFAATALHRIISGSGAGVLPGNHTALVIFGLTRAVWGECLV